MKFLSRVILATSVRRPFGVLLLVLPLFFLAALGMPRINFEDGLRSMFTSDSQVYRDFTALTAQFAQSETDIAVLISSPDPLNRTSLENIQNFILEAQFQDGISGVFSIFSQRARDPVTGKLIKVLPDDLADKVALNKALHDSTNKTTAGVALVSKDLRETVVYLSFGPDVARLGSSARTVREVRALARRMSADSPLTYALTGLLPLRDEIIAGLKVDQIVIDLLGGVLGLIVSLLTFRSFWVAGLNTVTPVAALVFCLGAFGWLGLSINALTNALPVLILVLASSDSIHLTYEIRRRLGAGETDFEAVSHAIRDMAPPCVLTSLTTVLAFSSLLYSSSPIIRDLAVAGAAGVLIAMFTVLFLHPVVFLLGARFTRVRRALPMPAPSGDRFGWIGHLAKGSRQYRAIALGGIILCAFSLWELLPVQSAYSFLENIDASQPVVKTLLRVEEIAGPVDTISIPMRLKAGHDLSDPAVMADLGAVRKALVSLPEIRAVVSLASLKPLMQGRDGTVQPERFNAVLKAFPARLRARLVRGDRRAVQVVLLVPDIGSQHVARLTQKIGKAVGGLRLSALVAGRPTGFLVMSSALSDEIIRQLTISFLIAALACPALIGVWFRRIDFGLAAIVPNILPIALVGAGLTMLGYDIQITSALALTIAFGIALDDSIHVFNRMLLLERQEGAPLNLALIERGMTQVSPVLIATTIILSSGLLATQLSQMPMIRFFGLLSIVTFFFALVCDLFLLPALLRWLARSFEKERAA